jgi:hypothetical protein
MESRASGLANKEQKALDALQEAEHVISGRNKKATLKENQSLTSPVS